MTLLNGCVDMKIGIITFCGNGNFGSELQAIAMNDFCEKQGHNVTFCIAKSSNKLMRIAELISGKIEVLLSSCLNKEYREFYKQTNKNAHLQISITETQKNKVIEYVMSRIFIKRLSAHAIRNGKFDCYICGSDQIWSAAKMPFGSFRFLAGIPSFKKIAYAPSFGINTLPEFFRKRAMKYIIDFNHLSVRELTAQKCIQENTGLEAKIVLDPTMMIGRKYWEEQIINKDSGCCVFYFLGELTDEQAVYINRIADGRKIIVLPSNTHCKNLINAEYYTANPIDFISYIYHADMVFTDSFHGTAFSILFEKEFITFNRTQADKIKQTSRIFSLLEQFGLKDRFCDNINNFVLSPLDFAQMKVKLQQKQLESRQFLIEALSAVENYALKRKEA